MNNRQDLIANIKSFRAVCCPHSAYGLGKVSRVVARRLFPLEELLPLRANASHAVFKKVDRHRA